MIFAAIIVLVVGILIIAQWTLFLATDRVPERQTEPVRLGFHLAAEFLTAATLIAGGISLLADLTWGTPLTLLACGMLLYTVIVSPGYFAQRREWPLVVMFGVLLVLTLASVVTIWPAAP